MENFVKDAQIMIRKIPTNLRAQYKALCARRGTNMSEALIRFIRTEVWEERKRLAGLPTTEDEEMSKQRPPRGRNGKKKINHESD